MCVCLIAVDQSQSVAVVLSLSVGMQIDMVNAA